MTFSMILLRITIRIRNNVKCLLFQVMPDHPLARNSTYKRLQEVQGGTVTRGMSVGSRYLGPMNQVSN